ncbi:MAG: hypothetical protein F9K40_21460 [Kofleriaceae bacterium]|nr:MAG: hypothetical protein F9K40_21460 [Kofleriaceae bacterium]
MKAQLLLASLIVACCPSPRATTTPPPPAAADVADAELAAAIDPFIDAHLAFRPSWAVELGDHAYDG